MRRPWWSCIYFVLTTLSLFPLTLAGTATADDTDAGMFYSGLWIPDGDPNTFGHHDTWTNQSGASVTFDFIGTQIQVFATRRPSGTYLTNVSFSIDGRPPILWTTSDFVPEITYKNLVYTSPSLSPSQHHITITNLGAIFWLDYVQFTTADSIPSSGGEGSISTDTSRSSSQIPSTTSSTPPVTSTSHTTTLQPQPSAGTTTSSDGETSTTTPLTVTSQTSSSSETTSGLAVFPTESSSTTTAQSSTGASAGTASPVPANASSGSSSRTPIIIGVIVGVVGLIALLLAALWWLRMHSRRRQQTSPDMTFATAPELGLPVSQEFTKDRPASSPPSTPHPEVHLLGAHEPTAPTPVNPGQQDATLGQGALGHLSKLQEEQASSARGMSPSFRSSDPDVQRPLPNAPESRTSGTSALRSDLMDGVRSSFTDSDVSGSNPPNAAPVGPTVRRVRYSRDAGIRLAGGPLGEVDSQTWTPGEYDDVETLPPSYAHIHRQ